MTPLLLWFLRLLVLFLVVRLIVRGMYSMVGRRQTSRQKSSSRVPERAGGTLVRDPQCGTYVPESRALVLGRGPDALHFCSTRCRDAWTSAHDGARAKA
jgi:hypothetical protein